MDDKTRGQTRNHDKKLWRKALIYMLILMLLVFLTTWEQLLAITSQQFAALSNISATTTTAVVVERNSTLLSTKHYSSYTTTTIHTAADHWTAAPDTWVSSRDKNLTISIEGKNAMHVLISGSFKGNPFCDWMSRRIQSLDIGETLPGGLQGSRLPLRPQKHMLFRVAFHCQRVFQKSNFGTGNIITVLYGIRLAARRIGNVDVQFTCQDATEHRADLVLPWLMGYFPASDNATRHAETLVTTRDVCERFNGLPVHHMLPEMQLEFRRMALELVGVPDPNHRPTADFVESLGTQEMREKEGHLQIQRTDEQPFFPNTLLDDAVFHLRCGDIMTTSPESHFGRFHTISHLISPQAQTIGIITAPFKGQGRRRDMSAENLRRCKLLAGGLQAHLESRFPRATVSIRSGENETIALAYSRFIMANQSIAGKSTFPIFPMFASFGAAYLQERTGQSRTTPGYKLFTRGKNLYGVARLSISNFTAADMKKLWTGGDDEVLDWFRQDST